MTTAAKEVLEALTECLQKNNQMTMKRAAWLVTIKSALTHPTAPEVEEARWILAQLLEKEGDSETYAALETLITAATKGK
jgi:hypothetical protein